MRRHLFTASSALRVGSCPPSIRLPQLHESSGASECGNDSHSDLEKWCNHKRTTGMWPEGTPPELVTIIGDAEILGVELAMVWDSASGTTRRIGESVGREYGPTTESEIPVTVDLCVRDTNRGLRVIDWKSRTRVAASARNPQVHTQAVACASLFGDTEVTAGLVYLDNWYADMTPFDGFDLDTLAGSLALIVSKATAATATDPLHLGPWCEYCPAQVGCPAKNAVLVSAANLVRGADTDALATLSDEDAGLVYVQLGDLSDLVEKARKIIKDRARKTTLPLPDGKVLACIEKQREGVDHTKAAALLTSAGIPVPMKVTTYTEVRAINAKKEVA